MDVYISVAVLIIIGLLASFQSGTISMCRSTIQHGTKISVNVGCHILATARGRTVRLEFLPAS